MPINAETVILVFCPFSYSGTIGIAMSSLVDRVIGLDVVDQAIQDAEFNALLNGIEIENVCVCVCVCVVCVCVHIYMFVFVRVCCVQRLNSRTLDERPLS